MSKTIEEKHGLEFIKGKYYDEKLSFRQIGDLLECSGGTINYIFSKHGLSTRNGSESRNLVKIKSKYHQLNDKEWLYNKYIIEELSTNDITKIVGAKTQNSVRQHLIKHGIEVRSISEGLTIGRKDDGFIINLPVIEGCLLGDGYLNSYNKESDLSYPCFLKKNKNYDHIKFVSQLLFGEKWEMRISEGDRILNNKRFNYFSIRSLSNKDLMPVFRRWYPEWNDYKKVIPEDLEVSSELMLHLFLDDGCSCLRKRKKLGKSPKIKERQIIITLCTECFSEKDQKNLALKIYDCFGLDIKVRSANSGTGWRMYVLQSQADLFYEIIGPCPVPSMEYKWK